MCKNLELIPIFLSKIEKDWVVSNLKKNESRKLFSFTVNLFLKNLFIKQEYENWFNCDTYRKVIQKIIWCVNMLFKNSKIFFFAFPIVKTRWFKMELNSLEAIKSETKIPMSMFPKNKPKNNIVYDFWEIFKRTKGWHSSRSWYESVSPPYITRILKIAPGHSVSKRNYSRCRPPFHFLPD